MPLFDAAPCDELLPPDELREAWLLPEADEDDPPDVDLDADEPFPDVLLPDELPEAVPLPLFAGAAPVADQD